MTEMISELSEAELDAVAAAGNHGGTRARIFQTNAAFQAISQVSAHNTNTATATVTTPPATHPDPPTAIANAGNQTAAETAHQSNTATIT